MEKIVVSVMKNGNYLKCSEEFLYEDQYPASKLLF